MRAAASVFVAALCFAGVHAASPDYSGSFFTETPQGRLTLTLTQSADGAVNGSLDDGVMTLKLAGMISAEGAASGAVTGTGHELGFLALANPDGTLRLDIVLNDPYGEPLGEATQTLVFTRASEAGADPQAGTSIPATGAAAARVFVNRKQLDAEFLRDVEARYGVPIEPGRYWYDAACGAWGVEGGPTAGFLPAGLDLPGPLPADISQGGTGIFINGREIHPFDQAALQQLFGVTYAGRYWLDAQGNLGPEGGPAIANLFAAMQAAAGSGGEGSVTHGYGQGGGPRGTLAGGMYSGRTATGKSVFWYPGM